MDFIKLFDWSLSTDINNDVQFIDVTHIKSSATNRILNGTYKDPSLKYYSDSESKNNFESKNDVKESGKIYPSLFNQKIKNKNLQKPYVPGLRPLPLYPKGSSLNKSQHEACLRVKATQDNTIHIIPIPLSTEDNYKVFEQLQQKITEEQKQFTAWAKTIWSQGQCVRVLRPKPFFMKLAEADFQMRQSENMSLPQDYQMAAQISLPYDNDVDFVFVENIGKQVPRPPEVVLPNLKQRVDLLTSTIKLPTTCSRHSYHINLPGESIKNIKSRTEVIKNLVELAQMENVQFVVSGSAMQALADLSKPWHLTVTVKQQADLGAQNVILVDGPLTVIKPTSRQSTARAIALLLQHEMAGKASQKFTDKYHEIDKFNTETSHENVNMEMIGDKLDENPDSEDDRLIIDINELDNSNDDSNKKTKKWPKSSEQITGILTRQMRRAASTMSSNESDISWSSIPTVKSPTPKKVEPKAKSARDVSTQLDNNTSASTNLCCCDCIPTFRKYHKWELRPKKKPHASIPIIIHTSHKLVKDDYEVIINPIVEYQVEIGASAITKNEMQTLVLALHLRKKALVLSARVDACSGELITLEWSNEEQLQSSCSQSLLAPSVSATHALLDQLKKLNPGIYVLKHEPSHGTNSMLYVASNSSTLHSMQNWLSLQTKTVYNSNEELEDAKVPPEICDALLPIHRHRKQLPLMFPPDYRPRKQHLKKQAEKKKKEAVKRKQQLSLAKKKKPHLRGKQQNNFNKKK